jgi:hypothetical protein
VTALRARALEASLHRTLQHRFNEDYWRNPATAAWLRERFSRGGRDGAEKLAEELGGPLQLGDAAERVVKVMGA